MDEYEATQTNEEIIEELADLLELIHAVAAVYDTSFEGLERLRVGKWRSAVDLESVFI